MHPPATCSAHARVAKYTSPVSRPSIGTRQMAAPPQFLFPPGFAWRVQARSSHTPRPAAASVHRLLWILWKTAPSATSRAADRLAAVESVPFDPTAVSARSTGPFGLPRPALTPPRAVSIAVPPPRRRVRRPPGGDHRTDPIPPHCGTVRAETDGARARRSGRPRASWRRFGSSSPFRAAVAPAPALTEKPSFPIINRKRGVCGNRVSRFCTFSTAVEDPVDKSRVRPANERLRDDRNTRS